MSALYRNFALCLFTAFSLGLNAQTDFSQFNVYDDELVEDLQLTTDQVEKINQLELKFGSKRSAINQDLLYYTDQIIELEKVEKERNKAIAAVLNAEQSDRYSNLKSEKLQLRSRVELSDLKERFGADYAFLNMDQSQIGQLATQYQTWNSQPHGEEKEFLRSTMKDILSKSQFKAYKKYAKKDIYDAHTLTNYWQTNESYIARMEAKEKVMKDFYLAERAKIRNQFERLLSNQDKEDLAYLREEYFDLVKANFSKKMKYEKRIHPIQKEYLKASHKHAQFAAENLINIPYTLESLINRDRETFYFAKDLAVKYDPQIDALQGKLRALYKEVKVRMQALLPAEQQNRNYHVISLNDNPIFETVQVEMDRNLAFLLLDGDLAFYTPDVSKFSVYPNPAGSIQNLELNLDKEEMVQVEIINAEGKMLKEVFRGNLEAGVQKIEVQLNDIQQAQFFYKIKVGEEVVLKKGLKK